jgi:hypothetical protein
MFVAASTLLLSATLGCVTNRTEIVLGMATDLTAPTPLSSVELQIYSLPDNVPIADQPLPISGNINGVYELPGTYAVYSASGSPDRFRAVLTATDQKEETLVVRSAVLSLVPNKTLFARLGVVSACEGMTDCGTGETCIEGKCASEEIDSSRLPAYTAGMESQVDCAGGTTFVDTSTKKPLTVIGTSCGTETCLEGICLTPPPSDGGDAAGARGGAGGAAGTGGGTGKGAGGTGGQAGAAIGGASGHGAAGGAAGTPVGGARGQGGAAGRGVGGQVSVDAGVPGAMGYPLLPDTSGAVTNDGAGIVGTWFSFADGVPASTSSCLADGATACSKFGSSSPAQGSGTFSPSDVTEGKMCASGSVAQVVMDTASPSAPDNSGIYGAYIALGLNQVASDGGAAVRTNNGAPVDGGTVFDTYDATKHGIVGFSFDVDNVPSGGLQVEFTTAAVPGRTDFSPGSTPAYWGGKTSGASLVVSGSNVIPLSQVGGPWYLTDPPPFDPTKIIEIAFHAGANTTGPLPFNFCISNLVALTSL